MRLIPGLDPMACQDLDGQPRVMLAAALPAKPQVFRRVIERPTAALG